MVQSKGMSLLESSLNTLTGFIISLLVWEWYVVDAFDLSVTRGDNLMITFIFTAVSLVRGFMWRRLFVGLGDKDA